MTKQWWYFQGEQKGPVSAEEIRSLLSSGQLTTQTPVWTNTMTGWAPIAQAPEFQSSLANAVPQIAPHLKTMTQPNAGGWRRFFARITDMLSIGLPTGAITSYLLASWSIDYAIWIQGPGAGYIFGWLAFPLVLLLESLVYGAFKTTLGKYLFNIQVVDMHGQPLTFEAYFKRQISIYWRGLATGFPFVQLIPMLWQAHKLGKDGATTYDKNRYQVKAGTFGIVRTLVSAAVIIFLMLVVGFFQALNRHSEKAFIEGISWSNAVTGKPAKLPMGWTHQSQTNPDGQRVDVFFSPTSNTYVVFGKEDVSSIYDIDSYASLFAIATRSELELQTPGESASVAGRQGWMLNGNTTADKSRRVNVTMVRRGNQIWRVVIVAGGGQALNDQTQQLRDILLGTL